MDRPTVLIADQNEDFRLALARNLEGDFAITGCGDGKTALELLRSRQPDFLILDLLLPHLDGLSLLQNAALLSRPPKVLVITRMYNDFVLDSSAQLGIQYIIQKPCSIAKAAARFRDIYAVQFRAPEDVSQEILLELSFDLSSKGGADVCRALPLVQEQPQISFRGELYPAVDPNAERNIRFAIEHAWKNGSPQLWKSYFPDLHTRPSNRTFLLRMARELGRRLPK